MTMEKYKETLLEFLNTPLDSGDQIFDRFASLPGAVAGKGDEPLERYVYIPGKRKDRVVLVAHIDTIWDKAYGKAFSDDRAICYSDGIFSSSNPDCGIGADDRAGCAMLWELRDSGHSILITDGEEKGKVGAWYLRKSNQQLFRELNKHCYMMELDWKGTNCCLFNQVDNTKKFKKQIENVLGFTDSKAKGGTDLAVLCRRICGVNLGVGYRYHHTAKEGLVLSAWENTLIKLREYLAPPQTRFCSKFFPPYVRLMKRAFQKLKSLLKK